MYLRFVFGFALLTSCAMASNAIAHHRSNHTGGPPPVVVAAPAASVGGLGAGGLGGAGLVASGIGAAALVGLAVVAIDDDDSGPFNITINDSNCAVSIEGKRNIKKVSVVSDDGSNTNTTNYNGRVRQVTLDGVWNDYVSASIFVNSEVVVPDEVPESCACGIGDGTAEQVLQAALDNTVLATVQVVGDGNISCTATNIEFDFTYKSSAPSDPIQRGGNLLSVYYNLIPGSTETKDQCFAVLCP